MVDNPSSLIDTNNSDDASGPRSRSLVALAAILLLLPLCLLVYWLSAGRPALPPANDYYEFAVVLSSDQDPLDLDLFSSTLEFDEFSRQIVSIGGDPAEHSLVSVSEAQCLDLNNPHLRPSAPPVPQQLPLDPIGVGDSLPAAGEPFCLRADFGVSQLAYRRSGDHQTFYHPLTEERLGGKVSLGWQNPPVQLAAIVVYLAASTYFYVWYYRSSRELNRKMSTKIHFWYIFLPGGYYFFHDQYNRSAQEFMGVKSLRWPIWILIVLADCLLVVGLVQAFKQVGAYQAVDQSLLIKMMAALILHGLILFIYQHQFNSFNRCRKVQISWQ